MSLIIHHLFTRCSYNEWRVLSLLWQARGFSLGLVAVGVFTNKWLLLFGAVLSLVVIAGTIAYSWPLFKRYRLV
jgi:4-hydroxybenzoate polyprenyltransferase